MESRRTFFGKLIALTSGLALLPAGQALAKKLAVGLDKVPKLKDVGGWLIVKLKGKDVLFVRDGEDSIKAIDPVCTHQKCLVAYNPESKMIECPCHKSHYGLDGRNISGPSPKPLNTYPAKLSKGRIIVDLG